MKCFIVLCALLMVLAGSCKSELPGFQPANILFTPAITMPVAAPTFTTPVPPPTLTSSTTTQEQTITSTPSPTASNTNTPFTWHAGDKDVNGNLMYGTEIMRILSYNGKLYATTSMWMESDPSIPKACQLLVLDSPDGRWKILHQFTTRNLRLVSLETVTFGTDAVGKKIMPVTMLLVAPDTIGAGDAQVFSLDDNSGKLVPMSLGVSKSTYTSTRAIGSHHDAVTGIDLVFAGNDILGMFSGTYDPSSPGRVKWQTSPELDIPVGERVMGFANSNGILYCSTSRHIYKRIDGPKPTWREVYFCPQETNATGIRGLTAVPNPSGKGEVLLFGALSAIRHIDPVDNYKETVELDMKEYLGKLWNRTVPFVLSAYNDFLPYTDPRTGEKVYLFGFESEYKESEVQNNPQWRVYKTPAGAFAAEGRYFIRHATEKGVSFDVEEITDPTLSPLVSIRTIAMSPFATDEGQVLYFGGFDCNSQPSHNTGWIYRGPY